MFLDEVFRLHKLVSHFMEHQEADHSIGLVQFLRLHYFDPGHDRTDPTHHASLPLHNHADTPSTLVFKGHVEQIGITLLVPAPVQEFGNALVDFHESVPFAAIFQPPRAA
jgi:hypothetical protein